MSTFLCGSPSNDEHVVELLRCALVRGDQEARVRVQLCLGEVVRGWFGRHPNREALCRLDSEENYVAQTFERFWQATALTQHIEFNSLAGAFQYLHACLNGAVIDTLRAYSRSKEIPLPDAGEPGELQIEDNFESNDVWDTLKKIIPNGNEQRLAYLLFHCGLKPRQIMLYCPQEFSDVHDIYRLRSNVMNRLLRNADHLRWRLN